MTTRSPKTTVSADGLRYVKRSTGTPFTSLGTSARPGPTMSCFLCGQHWPRSDGEWRKFLGKPHFICGPCGQARPRKDTSGG